MQYVLHSSIERSADRAPGSLAFRCADRALTYDELVRRANALAHRLVDLGVKRHDRIGIYMNKRIELPVAIYGVWKAGAAYVPLDPQAPPGRLRTLIEDCSIRYLLTEPERRRSVEALALEPTPLEHAVGPWPGDVDGLHCLSWEDALADGAERGPDVRVLEDDLAYVIYTSGSTGPPKGIMHSHRSGLAYAELSAALYGLRPEDRMSNHAPLHSDMSTFEFLSGPLAGAGVVIIPEDYTKLPASLSELLERERVTVWYSVVSALVQLSTRGVMEERDLSALRWVNFCGEPMPAKSLRRLMEMLPGARFSNVYGPAEVNQCTYYNVPEPPRDDAEPVPIGRVWDNTEDLVLDETDAYVAPGEVGELVIRSATMMRGYWNRPDLDARAFYRREAAPGYDEVFYRTGDLVRRREDGEYLFLGRKDRQIKSRGHRVELDEVEAALTALDDVEEAAAFAVPEEEIGNRIEAAVVLRPGSQTEPSVLLSHLRRALPSFAVPRSVEILDAFPRTPTGKIDRPALRVRAMAV